MPPSHLTPYLLYSDVHLHAWDAFSTVTAVGLNSRLDLTLEALDEGYRTAVSLGVEQAFCAGDLFHQRGKIAPSVLIPTIEFFSRWRVSIDTALLAGNHDLETNLATRIGDMTRAIPDVLCADTFTPTFTKVPGGVVVMVPWQPSVSSLLTTLQNLGKMLGGEAKHHDLIIHAPLDGVLRGVPEHGLTPERLLDACPARRIFCGHYHHHIGFDNRVYSVGALTHQTWSDVGTQAGYLLVYPDHVEHFETAAPKFVDISDVEIEDPDELAEFVKGNYVRTTLNDPTNDDVATIRNALTAMGAKGVQIKAIQTKSMTHRRTTVGASLDRLEESVTKFATDKGGPELAQLCEEILKHTTRATWSS